MKTRPLRNRVTPFGEIVADPARGLFMGNRGGRIHDPQSGTIKRPFASRRWIYCLLDFKERRRTVMGAGYTELFFFDEATALAAGHRPCFECQRARAVSFAQAIGLKRAGDIDARLHAERCDENPFVDTGALPAGAMISIGDHAFLVRDGAMRRWSFAGYGAPQSPPARAILLTPPTSLAALANGFSIG